MRIGPSYLCFLICIVFSQMVAYGQSAPSQSWIADLKNGHYRNPVIHADYSDPDVICVGEDFYMISSSFSNSPGLPILHSKDLVNWTIIGHALPKLLPRPHYDTVRHGGGVWAPSIRYHQGEFYIYYPDPDFGIYLTKAKNIAGPWSEPALVEAGAGLIDPCPLWDDDGKVYLVHAYAGSRAGFKSVIVIKEMNSSGTRTISPGVLVFDGHDKDPTVEGPKIHKKNGYYYLFAPAGGVSTGWQLVLRSRNIYGPYERKVVMDQGTSQVNGPHQGAWVHTAFGEDWFVHFQDKKAYGRVVHLQPMLWKNDWPVIGSDQDGDGKGEPVLTHKKPRTAKNIPVTTPAENDEFDSDKIGMQWQWEANPPANLHFLNGKGSLVMFSNYHADSAFSLRSCTDMPGQKLPAESFRSRLNVTVKFRHHKEKFGLAILGRSYAYIALENRPEGLAVIYRQSKQNETGEKELASIPVTGQSFILELKVDTSGNARFAIEDSIGTRTEIKETFNIQPGHWVGARISMFCHRSTKTNDAGYAEIDWFRVDDPKIKP